MEITKESRLVKIVYDEKTGRQPQIINRTALAQHESVWNTNIIDVISLDDNGQEIRRKAPPRPLMAAKREISREEVEAYLLKLGKSKSSIATYLGKKEDKEEIIAPKASKPFQQKTAPIGIANGAK